jgi:hypothetical protein
MLEIIAQNLSFYVMSWVRKKNYFFYHMIEYLNLSQREILVRNKLIEFQNFILKSSEKNKKKYLNL